MKRILVARLWLGLLVLATAGVLAACRQETPPPVKEPAAATIKDITVREASDLIRGSQDSPTFIVLDVRTPSEFEGGRLAGAVNIDFYSASFQDDIGRLDKNRTYLVYCATGRRSKSAVDVMEKLGFRTVYNMLGGIAEWQREGYPTVK